MNDDKDLKDIFSSFQPGISNSADFMARLNRNMEVVEHVRQKLEAQKRSNRRAVVVAAIAGFAGGAMSALAYPALVRLVAMQSAELAPIVSGAVLSGLTLGLIFAAYDLARALQTAKS